MNTRTFYMVPSFKTKLLIDLVFNSGSSLGVQNLLEYPCQNIVTAADSPQTVYISEGKPQGHKEFSQTLHNTRMPISPTLFWLCH